jgi:hypothetical protein
LGPIQGIEEADCDWHEKKKVEFQNSSDSRPKSQISSNYTEQENTILLQVIFFKRHEEKKQAGFQEQVQQFATHSMTKYSNFCRVDTHSMTNMHYNTHVTS